VIDFVDWRRPDHTTRTVHLTLERDLCPSISKGGLDGQDPRLKKAVENPTVNIPMMDSIARNQEDDSSVKVAVRVRPLSAKEKDEGCDEAHQQLGNSVFLVVFLLLVAT